MAIFDARSFLSGDTGKFFSREGKWNQKMRNALESLNGRNLINFLDNLGLGSDQDKFIWTTAVGRYILWKNHKHGISFLAFSMIEAFCHVDWTVVKLFSDLTQIIRNEIAGNSVSLGLFDTPLPRYCQIILKEAELLLLTEQKEFQIRQTQPIPDQSIRQMRQTGTCQERSTSVRPSIATIEGMGGTGGIRETLPMHLMPGMPDMPTHQVMALTRSRCEDCNRFTKTSVIYPPCRSCQSKVDYEKFPSTYCHDCNKIYITSGCRGIERCSLCKECGYCSRCRGFVLNCIVPLHLIERRPSIRFTGSGPNPFQNQGIPQISAQSIHERSFQAIPQLNPMMPPTSFMGRPMHPMDMQQSPFQQMGQPLGLGQMGQPLVSSAREPISSKASVEEQTKGTQPITVQQASCCSVPINGPNIENADGNPEEEYEEEDSDDEKSKAKDDDVY